MSSIIRASDNFDPQDLGAVSSLDTLTEAYLSGLGTGTDGQAVFSDGAGNFEWADVPIKFLSLNVDTQGGGLISTTSTSYVDTGLNLTITPQEENSFFIVFATHNAYTEDDSGDESIWTRITYDGAEKYETRTYVSGTNNNRSAHCITHMTTFQSGTTEPHVVKVQHKLSYGTGSNYWNWDSNHLPRLTVIEVLA
jgi:hypothetical protein